MIDTSKCRTSEERYDAITYEQYSSGIIQLEKQIDKIESMKRTLDSEMNQLKNQINKYESYILAYKNIYPNRPWEYTHIE